MQERKRNLIINLVEQFYVGLLDRLIKTALDKDGQETRAALIQAFKQGGEEELRDTLIKLEALQEIKEQQSLDRVIYHKQ
ncbi:MAG: hypothetical protein IRD7MM_02115 [Candidatus Midichloria mitochondrii]|uniref:hypothetical protein n=1 Tax=Candidatus Midichloria mitochondrii TaxID=234827 RepID=UPI0002F2ADB2|nr:hypothetical protein [Candidatus Midichloria mitochondrii]MDJ1256985.1 hypothetical protein [Candidatus Midichloria mitochondrii]MDJ1288735.1 hypothetical protein [Candidatus Midichloria mitochondrii]MDJ1299558.1 hypothetical protein [Candidatus Midichloria mitochondrii]MDJ1313653.1 hypothetical protein [Candidatus Midichloria mitochondrii]MDJ1584226.1 hypothetical protein [Candidatus Midichloria mitochondrii]